MWFLAIVFFLPTFVMSDDNSNATGYSNIPNATSFVPDTRIYPSTSPLTKQKGKKSHVRLGKACTVKKKK